jgi:hypothetical protein
MSPETNDDRSAREIQDAMEDEAGRMQERVDALGEHAQDAEKKAQVTREQAEPDTDVPLGAVGGDPSDEAAANEEHEGPDEDPDGADEEPEDAGEEPDGADEGPDADDDRD